MTKFFSQSIIHKILFLGVFIISIFFVSSLPAQNQESTSTCSEANKQQILSEKITFYENFNQFLSTSAPNTEISQTAFDEYRKFLASINKLQVTQATNIALGDDVTVQANASNCQQFIEAQKQLIQETIKSAFQRSNISKQTYTLVEKYAQINQQFSDLKVEADQVSQKIQTFSQKLPCYSNACVQD